MSLYWVNLEISRVRNAISDTREIIREKEEEVRRLRQAKNELQACQDEFRSNLSMCTEPQLTATTWQGSKASTFDSNREHNVKGKYQFIYQTQINNVLSDINDKIDALNREIERLRGEIESYQSRLSYLNDYKRELIEREREKNA